MSIIEDRLSGIIVHAICMRARHVAWMICMTTLNMDRNSPVVCKMKNIGLMHCVKFIFIRLET